MMTHLYKSIRVISQEMFYQAKAICGRHKLITLQTKSNTCHYDIIQGSDFSAVYYFQITLTKEFCAQPLRQVWLIVCTKKRNLKKILSLGTLRT